MPSKTFQHLKTDKKERFEAFALKEFAENGYAHASVSKLVKDLDIAKGSVYQYFIDKKDLYEYLLEKAVTKKQDLLTLIDKREGLKLSDWFIQRTLVEIKFAEQFPLDHQLLNHEWQRYKSFDIEAIKHIALTQDTFDSYNAIYELAFLLISIKNAIVNDPENNSLSDREVLTKINRLINLINTTNA